MESNKKNHFDISALIVSYNEKEYLREAIESCFNQNTEYFFEVVVGDDGSDDGSIEILEEYSVKYPDRFTYFVNDRAGVTKENLIPSIRVSNVIKQMFKLAKGEVYTLISGDDYYCDLNRFQKMTSLLLNNRKLAGVCSYWKLEFPNGQYNIIDVPKNYDNKSFWRIYCHLSAFMFRKDCTNLLLNNFCDDIGMVLSILASGKISYIESVTYSYRQRSTSVFHTADKLENAILEVLVLQDILSSEHKEIQQFLKPTYAKIQGSIREVFRHRNDIDSTYSRFIDLSARNAINIINKFINYDKNKESKEFIDSLLLDVEKFSKIYDKKIAKYIAQPKKKPSVLGMYYLALHKLRYNTAPGKLYGKIKHKNN